MKRILIVLGLLAPALVLAYFTLQPKADTFVSVPLFHFYIVTFTTFSAAVVALMLGLALGDEARPRHVLASAAFAAMGSIFFTHGLATPNALIDHFHPAVDWSAWLTLFVGGALFAIAALDAPTGPSKLPIRLVVYFTVAGVLAYLAVAAFAPQWLEQITAQVEPWHRNSIFAVSLGLWLLAAFHLWRLSRASRNRVDGVLAFVAFWLATATVSMHRFEAWRLGWWAYHIILLAGFLLTVIVLAIEYEQARQFRLVRYYLAASLILTALLALIASALFTQFSYNTLVGEIENSARNSAANLSSEVAEELPDILTAADLRALSDRSGVRALFESRAAGLPIKSILVYDVDGVASYASEAEWLGVNVEDRAAFSQALAGETVSRIRPPDDPPATYHPSTAVYVLEAYAPVRPGAAPDGQPIGVVIIVQEAPELGRAILNARFTGLVTAAITMSLLFAALLSVVGRADRIITARTEELSTAYTNLRRAEAMRDNLTDMIVHDLRSPLTAIAASIELLPRFLNTESRSRVIGSAQAANRRMTTLIDDLLAVSKIEVGELKPNRQNMLLQPLLRERLEAYGAQATHEEKTLTLTCSPGLSGNIDAPLIGRVLDNLLGNAFKYTTRNGKIHVLASADNNNGRVIISVRDDGEGIPDEYKPRIFDKYVQAPNNNGASLRKGTGLGLTFCRLVVESHGGQILVKDAPGGGSEFSFWLPK
ncbi:MAG: hypothetical protein HYZ49_00845 [Chloroflexi bacterium]|nr:hypothetical protein [Chloroflexota bacterium]